MTRALLSVLALVAVCVGQSDWQYQTNPPMKVSTGPYKGTYDVRIPAGPLLAQCDNRAEINERPDLDNCILAPGSNLTLVIMRLTAKPAPSKPPARKGKPTKITTGTLTFSNPNDVKFTQCTGTLCGLTDPVEVPAIQETLNRGVEACLFNEPNGTVGIESCYGANGIPKEYATPNTTDRIMKRWTCADKSRILEHDESTPPRWWCRKVQP